MSRRVAFALSLSLGVIGCGEEKKTAEPAPAVPAPAAPTAVAIDAGAPQEPVSATGLPALAAASPTPEDAAKAKQLNKEALVLHRAGKLDEAIARYREAVAADPSHLVARYNLASVHATKGDAKAALAVLAEFRAAACAGCAERLARARNDGEWKALWGDAEFQRVTAPADVGAPAAVIFMNFGSDTYDEDEQQDEGQVRFEVELEPPPGWAPAPAIDIEVASKGKTLVKKSWKAGEAKSAHLAVRFRPPGAPVTATVTVDGKPLPALTAKAAELDADSFPYKNLPPKRPAKVARCDGLECPSFPAISADGTVLAVRDGEELMAVGDRCNPPVGERTHFYRIAKKKELDEIGSVSLTGFEVLRSVGDAAKLVDGHTATYVSEDSLVLVKDARGKVVAKAKADGSSVNLHASAVHRVVVAWIHLGLGGDCDEVADIDYRALTY